VDRIAGTTGAGDSAIAGFLCACARGATADSALRYASAAGSYNVTRADSLSGLVPWEVMTSALQLGWELDPLEIRGPGWAFDPKAKQWRGPEDSFDD
jgi:hypothetical protein